MFPAILSSLLVASTLPTASNAFDIVKDYSGTNFFQGWDFYGSWDNLTLGDVWWLNQTEATAEHLAYVNDAGHAIIRVDNTTNVPLNEKRNTVRITTQDLYDWGSLFIIDVLHIPYGCSVWPAFWTKGPTWPDDGEIDIIESINLNPNNQMALHTAGSCLKDDSVPQTGRNVGQDCSTGSGCVVVQTEQNSYGPGFAASGGGIWATQFDISGIYMWYWGRANIPANLAQATSTSSIDVSTWGTPSAAFPANAKCNLTEHFTPQQLVIDITLCGDWAGVPSIYGSQCGHMGPTGTCYQDNVVGPGSPKYDNAFFEINYVRAYTATKAAPTAQSTASSATVLDGSSPTATTVVTVVTTGNPSGAQATALSTKSSAVKSVAASGIGLLAGVLMTFVMIDGL
ncbi:concanavalin A-like lectin/glucanase domain-containing protein [Irpex rosettiformis]|uniref:Concanavalin A-like lectin/glucanase domain-containing protein n=1 Tax=Irpex rosettiformis TaxID=378272 RepID=A0ACB8U573_9APHY|nr:concanavalin A-like lectin/glucanase domain-containing protein [Irpex rosettiformis]